MARAEEHREGRYDILDRGQVNYMVISKLGRAGHMFQQFESFYEWGYLNS